MNTGKNAQAGAGFRSTIKNMADVIIHSNLTKESIELIALPF
ncbi:hypothetical protein ACULNC_04385 [Shigella flexneri]